MLKANRREESKLNDARLIRTKLQPPTTSAQLVARPHLLARLALLDQRKLALVHAPAGFGKTTLITQWRQARAEFASSIAWLSLDADDNENIRFLTYLFEALRQVEPTLAVDLVAVLESQGANALKFMLGDFVNSVAECERELFLVLEDWHLIESEDVHAAMGLILTHAPANLHVLISSRTRPQLSLARLRVNEQMVEINADDLRFTQHESHEFLKRIDSLKLSGKSLDLLTRTADGWVAALQLAALSLKTAPDPEQALRNLSGHHRAIGDYMTENVLANLAPDKLDFLLKTSILERMNGPLCQAVSGHADSQAILESLEREDMFIRPLDSQATWFRYHHLFATHLQRRLQRDYADLLPQMHRCASDWFADNGHADEAVRHALAGGATERAIELVDRYAMALVEDSRMASLLSLIKRLPEPALIDRPQLQMAIGWAHCLTHHPESAQASLDVLQAQLAGKKQPQHAELLAEARVLQACIDIYADRIERVETLIAPVLAQPQQHSAWVVAVAANLRSYGYIHSFRFDAARDTQAWARLYHARTQGPFSEIYGRFFIGLADAYQGNLRAAAAQFKQTLEQAHESLGNHSHAARLACSLWGQINYEYNDLPHAEQLLEESRALGAESGVADFSMNTYVPLARLRALQGDVAGAHTLLDEGAATASQLGLQRLAAAIDGERVRRYLADGDVLLAQRQLHAQSLLPRDADGITVQVHEFLELARARVKHAQGDLQAAVKILERLLKSARGHGRRLSEVTLGVRLAMTKDALGQAYDAEVCLFNALMLGAPQGMVRSFLDEGPAVTAMLERMRESARQGNFHLMLPESVAVHINKLIVLGKQERAESGSAAVESANVVESVGLALMVEPLKARELGIVVLLGKGCSNKEIGHNLNVSVDTVKWYLKSIYSKLAVHRRSQAVAEARRLGVIS